MSRNLPTSVARIDEDISTLAAITEPGRPYTRRAFTPMFLEGRAWLAQRFEAAGLAVHTDAAGNLIGRRPGRKADLGTIMLGSHSDTVPEGGRYDGIAGVSAALEVARALADLDIALDHDLEIIDFLAEEVSIFGVSCVGSRGISGTRPDAWLARENDGTALSQAIETVGGKVTQNAIRSDIAAFLELHIEQGPVLENEALDIGVVTAIAGITRIEITVEGRADHAGTTPMGSRKDALSAAARIALAVEAEASDLAKGDYHFAATVGEFRMEPNAANVVPSKVTMLIDARAERRADMEDFLVRLNAKVGAVVTETGVTVATPRVLSDNMPTPGDAEVLAVLEAACEATDARFRRMASGAGHDTAWMARITKAAMIFVPCVGGRSHTPDESATPQDIALGAAVLLEAVQRLDEDLQEKK